MYSTTIKMHAESSVFYNYKFKISNSIKLYLWHVILYTIKLSLHLHGLVCTKIKSKSSYNIPKCDLVQYLNVT